MTCPDLRCVVPTLNSADTLDATLLSLHAQKDTALEIVVVDSGSTDGTLDICRRWEVPTLYAEPGNMYRAINVGLRGCQSKWLAYLNSDDWLYPDSLTRLLAAGEETDADVTYGNCDYVDGQGRFVYSIKAAGPRQLLPLFHAGVQGIPQPAAIFQRRLYERAEGFNESYRMCGDADFYYRAVASGARFQFVGGPSVACFRLHAKQFSNKQKDAMRAEGDAILADRQRRIPWRSWATFVAWRGVNAPHYLLRILRESLLSRRIRVPRSIEAYTHD